jgi:putative ABC transport system permease protein
MNFKYIFKISFQAIKTNKSRAFLTILGIVIGISSIVLIMSIGKGAENLILGELKGFGSNVFVIHPGREPEGLFSSFNILFSDSLKQRELEALSDKNNVPKANKIMPFIFGSASASFGGEIFQTTFFGITDLAEKIYNLDLEEGIFFGEEEVKSRDSSIVIGSKVKEELFGSSDVLGEKVKIKGRSFRVSGVLKKRGSGSLINFDEVAFIPYTTAQHYIFGQKHFQGIVIEVENEDDLKSSIKDVEITLRNLHNIEDIEKDDFYIETQEDAIESVGTITNVLTMFLVAVAAISLLVGGIGIMNIMLVSVVERTREIGLRKSVGATRADILNQFLVEAVILTILGGIIGIILGTLLSFFSSLALSRVLASNWAFVFPSGPAILGLIVSASVGLIFGIYPANKASKKSPIEALRYE